MRDDQSDLMVILYAAIILGLITLSVCESTMIDTLDVYDVDESGDLSADELLRAEKDYVSGRLSESDYRTIMRLAVTPTLTDAGVMLPPPEEIVAPEPVIAEPTPTPTLPEEPKEETDTSPFMVAIILLSMACLAFIVFVWRNVKN